VLKVGLLLVIIGAGLLVRQTQPVSFRPAPGDVSLIVSAPFAISLFWVMYAYSGWNASTYITGELRRPTRDILVSVGGGTLVVTVLYVVLNAVFLRTTPAAEIIGKPEVAFIAANHIFGATGGKIMALCICLGLVSTVSALMWIGPRVTMTMGEDLRALSWLARRNRRGIPVNALLLQFVIVNVMLLTATFRSIVNYVQFSLTLCSMLAVFGLFVLRWRKPELPRPYRVWGYPFTPLVFLLISGWMLAHLLAEPSTRGPSLLGLATTLLALVIYFASPKAATTR
ncbi:MAG: amino acid permease, partial [Verrucomicrobiota bacterium]|nr:amino acid permease [Verrucomicrobiota bacterium]